MVIITLSVFGASSACISFSMLAMLALMEEWELKLARPFRVDIPLSRAA